MTQRKEARRAQKEALNNIKEVREFDSVRQPNRPIDNRKDWKVANIVS